MRYSTAQKLLERISYKPDTEFILEKGEPTRLRMVMKYLPDSTNPKREWGTADLVTIEGNIILDSGKSRGRDRLLLSKDKFLSLLQLLIQEVETHERQEWLQIDKVPLYNPHTHKVAKI